MVFCDPPDHTRIRKLFQAAFTRKALAALTPRINALVDGYLDKLADSRAMEVVADFSFRLPVEVVCDMLGVPGSDRILIRDWAMLILGALEPVLTKQQLADGNAAVDGFKAYLRELGIHFALVSPTFGFRGCDDRRLGPCRGPARAAPPAGAVGRKAGHEPANGGD